MCPSFSFVLLVIFTMVFPDLRFITVLHLFAFLFFISLSSLPLISLIRYISRSKKSRDCYSVCIYQGFSEQGNPGNVRAMTRLTNLRV
ncbi:hypothetical protein Scep_026258 [Stephania cephalantha]|uniref:Uncharacterized protein n=1 Tax=Stephania cephalantha TaxID=152367 RepID=A0AAP0EK75_9MAGN